jgi:putative iron-dependent peroxidase
VVARLHRHDRDLTGFIDGTENPSLARAPDVALIPAALRARAAPCCCSSVGRTTSGRGRRSPRPSRRPPWAARDDWTELDDKPESSHVARTNQEEFGDVFRRNMPYGTVTEHGTMFVGFATEQDRWPACSTAWPA